MVIFAKRTNIALLSTFFFLSVFELSFVVSCEVKDLYYGSSQHEIVGIGWRDILTNGCSALKHFCVCRIGVSFVGGTQIVVNGATKKLILYHCQNLESPTLFLSSKQIRSSSLILPCKQCLRYKWLNNCVIRQKYYGTVFVRKAWWNIF